MTTPMNTATRNLVTLAVRAGLRPATTVRSYRGVREIILSGPGTESVFGMIRVGVRSGRVLGGSIRFGNDGPRMRCAGYRELYRALQLALPAGTVVTYHGSITDEHGKKVIISGGPDGYRLADWHYSHPQFDLGHVRPESITATGETVDPRTLAYREGAA